MSKLFVVATPIGNLQDITLRALEVLKKCDIVLCEDTRITNRLLIKYDIKNKKLVQYNDNSDEKSRIQILEMLKNGQEIALVSDAGTPLISDPGHKLINLLQENNIEISPIPGASSLISAISTSGIACESFAFHGFLPSSKEKRRNFLENLDKNQTFAFFESPNRVFECLKDVKSVLGERKVAFAREITKIHEEIKNAPISEIIQFFEENPEKIRGEFVIIVEKVAKNDKISQKMLENEIKSAIKAGHSLKDLSKNIAQKHQINKKDVYNLALKMI